jgi:hypothetical protein
LTWARPSLAPVVFALGLLTTLPARAEGSLPELVIATETAVDAEAVRQHLRVELAEVASPARVDFVGVGGALRLRISFTDGTSEDREISLRDVGPSEVARVSALVIAESARAHRPVARAVESPPAPDKAPTPPARPPPPGTPRRERAWSFGGEGGVGLRAFDAARSVGIEPRLGVFVRHSSGGRLDAGAFYLRSSETDPLGRVTLDGIGGSIGASFERELMSSIVARVGPRFDLGAALGRGSPERGARGGTVSELLCLAAVELAVRYSIGPLALVLAGDVGGVVAGLTLGADDRLPLAWTGLSFAGRLGLSFE